MASAYKRKASTFNKAAFKRYDKVCKDICIAELGTVMGDRVVIFNWDWED